MLSVETSKKRKKSEKKKKKKLNQLFFNFAKNKYFFTYKKTGSSNGEHQID